MLETGIYCQYYVNSNNQVIIYWITSVSFWFFHTVPIQCLNAPHVFAASRSLHQYDSPQAHLSKSVAEPTAKNRQICGHWKLARATEDEGNTENQKALVTVNISAKWTEATWQLAFNAQKFRGSRDHGHDSFSKNFQGVVSGLSLETCMSNLKPVSLTVLQLLAFNAQKLGGHVTLATPLSEKF